MAKPTPAEFARDRLAVALDVPSLADAIPLMDELQGWVGWFKIGSQLFTAEGPAAVAEARRRGRVFLDTKLHDIPNTVAAAVRAAATHQVELMTLHASGGAEMMRAARAAAREAGERSGVRAPKLLAVTALTSLDDAALAETGIEGGVEQHVARLVRLALDAGLDGVVASAHEAAVVRRLANRPLLVVTPGIRAGVGAEDDQRRVANCAAAIRAGSDLLVVGRPIVQAERPGRAARELLEEIRKAVESATP